jgi:hypothetical protein
MANSFKVSITTLNAANTNFTVLTAAASTTLVKSVSFSHDDHNTQVTMGITKSGGTRVDLLTKTHTANEMTQLNNDVIALEAGDAITVASDHIGASDVGYVTVVYVENVTAVNGQSIDVLNDVDTTTALPSPGDVLTWDGNQWEPQAGGGGAVDSVNSQTGVVVLDMDDINDVNAPAPAANDVLKWTGAPTNAWQPVDWLSVMYAEFKQGGTTTVTNGGLTDSSLTLTSTEAKLKAGITGFDITETSPGTIETIVATDATGSTAFTAMTLEGLSTASQASFTVENGTRFYFSDGTYTHMVKPNSGLTADVINTLPDTTGTLALEADIPSTTSELTEGTNLYYTEARVSANSDVVANTAKRSYPIADETKLAGIAAGAEVNVNADWNATSGDALILNKPTIPTNTNLGNTDLTANTNRTYDIDGNALTIQLASGDFYIQDGATTRIEVNPFEVQINSISYPSTDGTSGQVMTTDGAGNLSFTTVSGGGGGGTPLASADQTLTGNRLIDTNGYNLEIELDPTGTADTFTIHDGTHDLFEVNTNTSGTIFSVNDVSGLPTFQSNDDGSAVLPKILTAAPTGTATEGTMQLGIVSGTCYLYVYINGGWKSTTLT